MTARILVVDDVPTNVKLLEAQLVAEFFEVLSANNGEEAVALCREGKADIVILDVMMPEMDGFEVCRLLKRDPATAHIPVVMVTALDEASDRIRGLEAGADDFLTRPVKELQLMTRVRSLVRLKMLTDELSLRAATARDIGLEDLLARRDREGEALPRVLLIDEFSASGGIVPELLENAVRLDIATDPRDGFLNAAEGEYECLLLSTKTETFDPLRLCSQLRSLGRTRFLPIILLTSEGEDDLIVRGLDIGINDYLVRPLNVQELTARVRTQVRRKRYNDRLRQSVTQTIEMAVTDPLTGLYNRRYLDSHLQTLVDRALARKRPLSVMITDIDRFKSVNDSLGHQGGDEVLREFARRLRKNVRGMDLACRFGGEEFVIAMPETDGKVAQSVAERLREEIAGTPFVVSNQSLAVTVSVGVSTLWLDAEDTMQDLLKRADRALYEAKNGGRNRVVAKAA